MLNWLSTVNPSKHHNAAIEKKESGTGKWFLSCDKFYDWVHSPGLIWLYGIREWWSPNLLLVCRRLTACTLIEAGCGKTVLWYESPIPIRWQLSVKHPANLDCLVRSSSIIDCIQDLCRAADQCKSAYFYFNFQDTAEQYLDVVLRSLLRQLAADEPQVPSTVEELCKQYQEVGHDPPNKALWDALVDTIRRSGKEIYIILDALDELPEDRKERPKVLRCIAEFVQLGVRNLHILATSRDEFDIRKALGPLSETGTCIQTSEVDSDISKYVGSCLQDWTDLSQDIKTHVQKRLSKGACGM